MKNSKIIKSILFLSIFVISAIGVETKEVENLNIPRAVGYDIKKINDSLVNYIISLEVHDKENEEKSGLNKIDIGIATNLPDTRQDRQLKTNKRFLLGLENIVIISEEQAKYGLNEIFDILINNPEINDMASVVICKGKAEDILKIKNENIKSASHYINDMVENSKQYNFFSTKYNLINAIIQSGAEGVHLTVPYLEIKDGILQITGISVFDEDKMVEKIDIEDMKIMNLLKESNVKGILTLEHDSKKYINYYGKSKRKVKCSRENGKCKFDIQLNLNGSIISNELYEDEKVKLDEIEKYKKYLENKVELQCYYFIDKMKKIYKKDLINLGRIAASKYGKNMGINWDEKICESDIKVHVKINIVDQGRGGY